MKSYYTSIEIKLSPNSKLKSAGRATLPSPHILFDRCTVRTCSGIIYTEGWKGLHVQSKAKWSWWRQIDIQIGTLFLWWKVFWRQMSQCQMSNGFWKDVPMKEFKRNDKKMYYTRESRRQWTKGSFILIETTGKSMCNKGKRVYCCQATKCDQTLGSNLFTWVPSELT